MPTPRYWPLVIVLLSDAAGIPLILYWWATLTYSNVMGAALIAFVLLIVQLPLCVYGAITSARAGSYGLCHAYVAHAVGTVLLVIVAELGGPRLFGVSLKS